MFKNIENGIFDIDFKETKDYYKNNPICNCYNCRNYQINVKKYFPKLDAFLSQFGIDSARPDEMGFEYFEKDNSIQYFFVAYTANGKIIKSGNEITLLDNGLSLNISISNNYYPNGHEIEEYFTITILNIVLPWLLDGEYPDKSKK